MTPGCGYGQLLVTPPTLQAVADLTGIQHFEPTTLCIPSRFLSSILFYF